MNATRRWPANGRKLCVLLGLVSGFILNTLGWAGEASIRRGLPSFAALVEQLSEQGGEFGGDNLISNEQSYLHVMPALERAGVNGGAYVGVGPDQNFSYIAQIKPAIAYIVDLRRDNLLLHLLFKAVFAEAGSRVEYLSLLTGRPAPVPTDSWSGARIDAIIDYIDRVDALPEAKQKELQNRLEQRIREFGIPLTANDLKTIASFRQQFVTSALSLVFRAHNQPLRSYYPSFRTLLGEKDRLGNQVSFMATEAHFQYIRSLQARDLIVPVVCDVSGSKAMRAVAADMTARGVALSAFYISNVEYYLYRSGRFGVYAENVKQFPHDARSIVIRSVFPSGRTGKLSQSVPGYYSTSITQPFSVMLEDMAAGKYRTYQLLIEASAR
jgi:hypothetical protein